MRFLIVVANLAFSAPTATSMPPKRRTQQPAEQEPSLAVVTQEEPPRSRVIPAKVAAPASTVARYSEGNRRLQERDETNYDKLYTAVSLLPENDDALDEAARLITEGAASPSLSIHLRLLFCCFSSSLERACPVAVAATRRPFQEPSGICRPLVGPCAAGAASPGEAPLAP